MTPAGKAHAGSAPKVTKARLVAHQVLVRVASEAAFSDRALDATIIRADLDDRDARLATELVYGTLRQRRRLDYLLGTLMKKPVAKLPAETAAALRLGAYQLLELRVADHSAVNESVSLVRAHHRHQAGFANAVLRELGRRRDAGTLADPNQSNADPIEALAISSSQPAWVLRRVASVLGMDETVAFAAANNNPPPLALRVNVRAATATTVIATDLIAGGAQVEPVGDVPLALTVRGCGPPARQAHFAAGHMSVQDAAAQLVGYLAAPVANILVVDVCAAPGGKTTHLAELMDDRGVVLALDIHPGKLRLVREAAQRLHLDSVVTKAVDATDGAALMQAVAEACSEGGSRLGQTAPSLVLVDAPCSGSGTLRRNPEVRERESSVLTELTALQERLLEAASSLVAPGGVVVYAVCSVTPEEGPERLRAFLERHRDFALAKAPAAPWLAPYLAPFADGHVLQTWPQRHGMDGFFAARMVRLG